MLGKLWSWLGGFLSDKVPMEVRLESDLEGMLKALDAKADIVAFSMARAEEAQEKLRLEVENYDSLEIKAAQFLADGDEEAAQRLVALQLQSKKEIETLTSDCQDLQQEAEQSIATYENLKTQVEERRKALPKLRDDARALKNEEEFQRIAGRFSLKNSRESFDETAREIHLKKLQAQSRNALEADPHAELDKRIQRTLQDRELEDAMQTLRQKIGRTAQTVVVVKEDSVAAARKLLEAPRANSALPAVSRSNTPVRNR